LRRADPFAAAEAAATRSRAARTFCSGRLRGHLRCTPPIPRAERGAGLSSAPPRAANLRIG